MPRKKMTGETGLRPRKPGLLGGNRGGTGARREEDWKGKRTGERKPNILKEGSAFIGGWLEKKGKRSGSQLPRCSRH